MENTWSQISSLVFPKLPAQSKTWKNAVKAHPVELLLGLQRIESPEFVVRSINASILQEWTRKFRIECLIQGLAELQVKQNSELAEEELANEIEVLQTAKDAMDDDDYIHSRDYWIKLRKYNPGGVELLTLCKEGQAAHLVRPTIAVFAYGPEIATIARRPFTEEARVVPPLLTNIFLALKHDGELKRAFYNHDPDGDLAAMETILAIRCLKHEEVSGAMAD
ncbi:hypothetical protein ON010_g16723 [Phytophthora cinnamomi]|nr:hypothetical protein ON010_g16723 [Phytophthora cinnamomi]